MKAFILFQFLLLLAFEGTAQNQIYLKINHRLGAEKFEYNKQVKNNFNEAFTLSRLQYYLSGIKIYHDGEINTYYPNKFMLITANNTFTKELIGDLNFETIEAIEFLIGVKTPENNADPTAWDSNHPLAPKEPTMHWGWTAGYRFLAMEGKSGASLDKLFEIHALGNDNLIPAKFNVTAKEENGEKIIELDADYTRIIESITVKEGVVFHGGGGIGARALKNFQKLVFTNNGTSSTDHRLKEVIKISPNPSNGFINIVLPSDSSVDRIYIYNGEGKLVQNITDIKELNTKVEINQSGLYFLRFYNKGLVVDNQMVSIVK